MIGAIIGGALKIGSSIYGGIKAKQAADKVKQNLEEQQQENENWYNRRYNEDATQRADAQRMITMVREDIKQRNRAAAGTAAVMGGTTESVAAAKEANNKALADTTSQIVAQGEARKDAIEEQYLSRKDAISEKINNTEQQRAQAITNAIGGVADAAGGIAGNLSGAFAPSKEDAASESGSAV